MRTKLEFYCTQNNLRFYRMPAINCHRLPTEASNHSSSGGAGCFLGTFMKIVDFLGGGGFILQRLTPCTGWNSATVRDMIIIIWRLLWTSDLGQLHEFIYTLNEGGTLCNASVIRPRGPVRSIRIIRQRTSQVETQHALQWYWGS